MNEALQEQLAELLQAMTNTVITGGEYAAGQLPELCRQVVLMERVATTLNVFCATVALVIWAVALRRVHRKYQALPSRTYNDEPLILGGQIAGMVVFGVILLAWLMVACPYALQAWLAPHMVLLDYVTGLLK
jgi:hypothetical protein